MIQPVEENETDAPGETKTSQEDEEGVLRKARTLLYVSHFGSQFSEWAWQFSLIVWLTALGDYSSLFLVSAYQATTQLLVLSLVPRFSRYIDKTASGTLWNRSKFASYVIAGQNMCVIMATMAVASTTNRSSSFQEDSKGGALWVCSLTGICLFGGFAQVFDKIFLVAVERDWIVVMAANDDVWLQKTNVVLKQMDLSCQVFGPSISGFVLAKGDAYSGVLWVSCITLISLVIEYGCMNKVYQLVPSLQQRRTEQDLQEGEVSNGQKLVSVAHQGLKGELISGCQQQLHVYATQRMVWAGLGLALLYFNVLTFAGMMTAYLVSCNMSLAAIGVWRGVASLVGLVGTFAFGQSQKYMTLETTALWSIIWQFLCLSVSLSSIFISQEKGNGILSATLLIAGVIPSRIGLYVYDISVTSLFQQTVPPAVRGIVGGTQMGLNSFFELLPFLLGMIFSDVKQFWVLVIGGYLSVGTAVFLYITGTYLLPYQQAFWDHRHRRLSEDEEAVGAVQPVAREGK
eukprot:CAMPEP_0194566734 /NCGR_PEP_ID=MMETSP0292-20121207/5493_1 /TAXON_ID=39354 /ORGANISM="Heterosigma akashiwo, Strain CCMP2393" /LENGTH=514 /DNA_ID=CAMNT_0039416367 /DNA_START=134 /DNA_END=1678 /DNA_ORIENTATION=-